MSASRTRVDDMHVSAVVRIVESEGSGLCESAESDVSAGESYTPRTVAGARVGGAVHQGAGVSGPVLGVSGLLPSPKRRKPRCHRSYGTSGSPGMVFSGKMNVNIGAVYMPARSPSP